jgi:hypothetical protein
MAFGRGWVVAQLSPTANGDGACLEVLGKGIRGNAVFGAIAAQEVAETLVFVRFWLEAPGNSVTSIHT